MCTVRISPFLVIGKVMPFSNYAMERYRFGSRRASVVGSPVICWRLRDIRGTSNKTVSALPALTSGAQHASLPIPCREAA
jgi:hypothetical protein